MRGRLLVAVAASLLVVIASPFVGRINSTLERAVPGQYVGILLASVLLPAVAAIGLALLRIRDRRALRYGLLAAAVAIAVVYATAMQTSRTEQFHFTEYGILTLLFYRAWHSRDDASVLVLPVCAALIAGIADEWVQWFVPSRVGEARDIVLNSVGIACGLMIAVALEPPVRLSTPAAPVARRALAIGLTTVVLAGALFVQSVHVGYDIQDAQAGTFRSRYPEGTLRELALKRASEWRQSPPQMPPLLSREDHYLSEAAFHVEFRNDAVARGDTWPAWKENLILERFYAPVLDSGILGTRWPAEQRAALEAAAAADARPYVSAAYPFPMFAWNRWLFWGVTLAVIALIWLASQ